MLRLTAWKGFCFGNMSTTEQRFAIWKNVLRSISTLHDEVSQTSFTALMDDASSSRMLLLFKDIYIIFKKKLYFVMVTMSRLNRDFQWAIRDKQSLLRARFLHLINMPGPGIESQTSGRPRGRANHYTTAPL